MFIFGAAAAIVVKKTPRPSPSPVEVKEETSVPVSGDIKEYIPAPPEPDPLPTFEEAGVSERAAIAKDVPGTLVIVDKSSYTMEVFRDGRAVRRYGVAVGLNAGDKRRVGDMRTPEGEFPIVQIQNASDWTHDFRDGKGQVRGAYGPYFIRLGTPGWTGIGIHGTHAPASIGTNVTEGCIRLGNDDVAELRRIVKIGDKVIIRR